MVFFKGCDMFEIIVIVWWFVSFLMWIIVFVNWWVFVRFFIKVFLLVVMFKIIVFVFVVIFLFIMEFVINGIELIVVVILCNV